MTAADSPYSPSPFPPVAGCERARILVVDDDAWVREAVKMALTDEGYTVHAAPHGAAALEFLEQSARSGQGHPDLILLDAGMPIMDGGAFAAAYRRRRIASAPIVVITAAADAAQRAVDIGADGALAKPFVVDELLAVVNAFARQSPELAV